MSKNPSWVWVKTFDEVLALEPPGGGVTRLYQLYVPPQRVWFFSRFGLKTGIDSDHYGLKSGWFSREPRERINVFVFSTPNK